MAERQLLSITLDGNSEEEIRLAAERLSREIDGHELTTILGLSAPYAGMRK
jgi:hypothetical protein